MFIKQSIMITFALFTTASHACGCSGSIENAGKVTGKAVATSVATSPNSSSYSVSTGTNYSTSNGSYTLRPDGMSFQGTVKTSTEGYAFNTSTLGAAGSATLDGTAKGYFEVQVKNPNHSNNYVRGGGTIDSGYDTAGAKIHVDASANTGSTVLATGDYKVTGEGKVGSSSNNGKTVYGSVKTVNSAETFANVGKLTVDGTVLQSAPATSVSDGVATTWAKFFDPQ